MNQQRSSSKSSSRSTAYVNASGASASSRVSATSSIGKTRHRDQSVIVVGARSARAEARAAISEEGTEIFAQVEVSPREKTTDFI